MSKSTPDIPVWTMNDKDFAAYASGIAPAVIASKIKACLEQGAAVLKRGAEWYWATGRWLNYVKANKLYGKHGDWLTWVKAQCGIAPATANRYMTFATHVNQKKLKSLTGERFNLIDALGYKTESKPDKPTQLTNAKPEVKVQARVEDTSPEQEDEAQDTAPPEQPAQDDPQDVEQDDEAAPEVVGPEQPEIWCDTDKAVPLSLAVLQPNKFQLVFNESGILYTFTMKREELQTLASLINEAIASDDGYAPDTLPQQSVCGGLSLFAADVAQ